jgi:hypothetical protein
MCTASSECALRNACVAGRCQPDKPTVKPAVDNARRIVLRPIDVGYVRSGAGAAHGALPTVFVLGHEGGKLFLRFAASLPRASNVVEAYVVLHRATVVDDDPAPISIHATRITESWEGGSISWALQPRNAETRLPSTTVEPAGGALVRVDVRELVRHWPRHDPSDHGIAILAENETRTGTTFALTADGAERALVDHGSPGVSRSSLVSTSTPDVEPYLELYVR